MSHRGAWIRALIVGAVLSWTGLASTDAFAQCCQGGSATGANMFTDGLETSAQWPANVDATSGMIIGKAQPESASGWWTHGELEVGGRDFLNDPKPNGSGAANANVWQQGNALAKYYEYSTVAPGAFGGGHVATGSNDGVYQVDLWANNVGSNFQGFSDQAYQLTASQIGRQGQGEQFFTVTWDQTPHVYSTTAETPYLGVGTNNLTLPPLATKPSTSAAAPVTFLLPFLHDTDLGIQRNTAAASYRAVDSWTAWDFGADYSYTTRTGTMAAGVIGFGSGPNAIGAANHGDVPVQVPAPVDDSTQNFGANGEYLGTSLWGQKFTFKVAYNGSIYTDNISSYTVQNPWGETCAAGTKGATAGAASCPSAQLSTWPSNTSNGVSEATTADLPLNSRYVGTTSAVVMMQNAPFLPMTNNLNAQASPNGVPWNLIGALPATSLAGNIDTLLSNNIITTKITPELTAKTSYRYYDFDNQTPQIIFPCWISVNQTGIAPSSVTTPCGPSGFEDTISSLSISYMKQNAGEELNWRPTNEWNFNGGFGWERYDWRETDVATTNEYSGKLSADWKPTSWLTVRASGYYADREQSPADYDALVKAIQFPTVGNYTPETSNAWFYSQGLSTYEQFMFDNRRQTKANFLLDVVAFPGVTITPTVKYKDDNYGLNPVNQYGLSDSKSVSTGVDIGWAVTRDLSFTFSYYYEYYYQLLYNANEASTPATQTLVTTTDKTYMNTITAAVKWAAIPNTLVFDARFTYSGGVDEQNCPVCTSTAGSGFPATSYPNDSTVFERVDATATYKFDPTWVHQMGFKGDLLARLRYTWERNSVANWQNDSLVALFPTSSGLADAIWMAYDNPNYNVQMLSLSLVAKW